MKTQTKVIMFFVGTILLSALCNTVYADEYKPTNNYQNSIPRGTSSNVNSQALSIAASQIHMDWNTGKLQGGIGTGIHAGSQAIAGSLGKRINGKYLLSALISTDGTDTAFGAGINFRF